MSRRNAQTKAVPRLSHEQAADLLVDYHFGRLSPKVNAAVEAHVKACKICQRQGLEHAATERREALRVRVKPARPLISRKARVIFFILLLAVAFQLAVFELVRPGSPLIAIFGHTPASAPSTPLPTATPTIATPQKSAVLDASTGATALALSPDGKSLAAVASSGGPSAVGVWDLATGKRVTSLPWQGANVPGALAWSPDGKTLAAADGATVGVWDVQSRTLQWQDLLPSSQTIRVYDVPGGGVPVTPPDATTAFTSGALLKWGSGGQLQSTPADALAPSGVAAAGDPIVSLWQSRGIHLFNASGAVSVGLAQADLDQRRALLAWSPDGHYLAWLTIARHTATSDSSAGLAPPDPVVAALAGEVASSNQTDADVWFSPDRSRLASCVRAQPQASLDVYDIASGRVTASLAGVCDHLNMTSVAWSHDGGSLLVAAPDAPITTYALAAPHS